MKEKDLVNLQDMYRNMNEGMSEYDRRIWNKNRNKLFDLCDRLNDRSTLPSFDNLDPIIGKMIREILDRVRAIPLFGKNQIVYSPYDELPEKESLDTMPAK